MPNEASPGAAEADADDAIDTIDAAAHLLPGMPLHAKRRLRGIAIEAIQASHDALLFEPVRGLSTADRLRIGVQVCEQVGAATLARHYRTLLAAPGREAEPSAPALPAMLQWAGRISSEPRHADRAALAALKAAGLDDAAVVALTQWVGFLSFQTRVVAGLRALAAMAAPGDGPGTGPGLATASPGAGGAAPAPLIRRRGFTNETLEWRSWLQPLPLEQATPLQQAVLDESHPQARSSEYYRTLVHQPLMLRHRSAAYNAIMYAPGGLPRAERELGAMVVSVTNGCVYCTSVHAQRYAQLARRHDTVEQVFDDPASAGSTERERAIARFARAVTLRPEALGPADLQPLRDQGLRDEDVIDLLHSVAIFGWANRLMHHLGEPEAARA